MMTFIGVLFVLVAGSWAGACFMKGFNAQIRKNEQAQMRRRNPKAALRLREMELEREREEAEEEARQKREAAELRLKRVQKGTEAAKWLMKK